MARTHSRFSGSLIGTGLELLEAGRVVTTDASALSIDRSVLSTLAQTEFDSFAEFIIYSATSPSIANKVSIGVCHASSSGLSVTSEYVGEHAESVGYRVGEGEIHIGGSNVQSVTAGALGSVVGVLLTWGLAPSVSFFLDGELLHTEALPSGLASEDVYYAVSLGSTDAGDILVWHNTGQRRFEYPNAVSDGWWTAADQLSDILISTRPYLSASDDGYPAVAYDGVILPISAVLSRSVSFWPSGDSSGAQKSALVVTIDNPDGRYNPLLGGAMRDAPVVLQSLEAGEDLDDAETLASFVFESCEAIGEGQLRITLLDDMTLLERSAQRRYFRPDAESNVASAPWPTTIGACFSVEPPCYDIDELLYAIDSEGASNVGKVRDKGDPLDQYAMPDPDYTIIGAGEAVDLFNEPIGTVTVDAAVTGPGYVPPTPTDALSGTGAPFAGTIGAGITGWTRVGDTAGSTPFYSGSGQVTLPQEYDQLEGYIQTPGSDILADTSYRWYITVHGLTTKVTTLPAYLGISLAGTPSIFNLIWSVLSDSVTLPATFTGVIAPSGSARKFSVFYRGNDDAIGDPNQTIISNVVVYELPPEDTSASDDDVENALPALNLTGMVSEIMSRAGRPAAYWDSDDTDGIDTDSGYRGSGWHSEGQWVPRAALNDILAGYSGAMYKDETGVLRFTRLLFPEDETATTSALRKAQMLTELLPSYDRAPGLTNTIACRKNWRVLAEGELVTDEIEVTMALRRKLARPFRFHRSSGEQLAPGYEHAEDAPPLETMLVDPLDAQAEIERVVAGYTRSRCYYTTSVAREDCPPLGSIVPVYYDDWGFSMATATNARCVAVEIDLTNEEARTVVLWALSPEELES